MEARKKLAMPAAIVVAVILGIAASSALVAKQANAATTDTATTPAATSTTTTTAAAQDESIAHHTGANGVKEELLTGDTAEKAKAAALAANPGGTIQRVETDAEGAAYEAHMTKSDGTRVTVKLDKDFKVTATEAGGGPGSKQ